MSEEKNRTELENQERTFFEQRIYDQLGVTEEMNSISIKITDSDGERTLKTPIFREDKDGNIEITVYTLDCEAIVYDKKGYDPKTAKPYKNGEDIFSITRLKEPKQVTKKDGSTDIMKYYIPPGAGTHPFFSPWLVEKFKKKEKIKTLVLTEGYFKAYKGCMHGLDVVGLSSITHYRDKDTKAMYIDVLRIIEICKVQNIIILYDGDCRNISTTAVEKEKDLNDRPNSFLSSTEKIRELLKDTDCDIYFAHIESEKVEGKPKGLDDLLIVESKKTDKIKEDLLKLSGQPFYFYRLKISRDTKKLYSYFNVNNINKFYEFHEDIIQGRNFIFKGTKYQVNEKGELEVRVPKDAKLYFRVGTTYYKHLKIPNKYKQKESQYHKWEKGAIIDDFGRDFLKHIQKYEAFCNVPDHKNFTQIIDNCFNTYHEFTWEPNENSDYCLVTLEFIKHIFEEHFEFGLDYIQLLYQDPTQQLPILCLVSRENETGKSTFIKYLKQLFGQNATIIGNSELNNDFNASYASRLVIMVEESFIEKKQIVEKIKALSTADKIMMNSKGKDHVEIDFFGKFILASNNEDSFIYATDEDRRYWVRKVKPPQKLNPQLMKDLIEEIPAFLNYLNKREMHTKEESRMWFDPKLLVTDALKSLTNQNKKKYIKKLKYDLRDAFRNVEIDFKFPYLGDKKEFQGKEVSTICCSVKGLRKHWVHDPKVTEAEIERDIKDNVKYLCGRKAIRIKEDGQPLKKGEDKSLGKPFQHRDMYISEEKEDEYSLALGKPGRSILFQLPDFFDSEELKELQERNNLPF